MNTQDKTTVACYGCGTELAPAQRTQVDVKGAGKQPMCRTCAANRVAKQTFGGVYLAISDTPNRAARRKQPKPAPVVKPARQRRATRGERRAAKKVEATKGKQAAA